MPVERTTHTNGTSYASTTPDEVVRILEQSRLHGTRIRIHYGDVETGRDWMDENDVRGTVGRSTGPIKIPLMIATSRSSGGGGILDHCIVRIRPSTGAGPDLYRHPGYHLDASVVEANDYHVNVLDREWPGWRNDPAVIEALKRVSERRASS